MRKTYNIALYALLLLFTALWLSSYTHHSSIGIDHDQRTDSGVLYYYYRINWTGNGSIWAGYGSSQLSASQDRKLEKFDPASAFLKPAQPLPESATRLNRFGLWYINSSKSTPVFWIGIPSWLPVLVLLFLIRLNRNYR